jgi:hypothetical protein
MLKLKISKDDHGKLPADIQKEYKAEGEEFVLDTDVKFEDVTPLKNALAAEKDHRKKATEKVTQLETQVAALNDEKEKLEARAKPASELEKSWQAKLEKTTTDLKAREDALRKQLNTLLVDNVAIGIANEVATSPELLLPHLKSRLTVEEVDGKFVTRVLDGEGKASALSVNELKQEVIANKQFAPIIKASNASGGGAHGGKGGASGKAFKDMSEAEKVTLFKTNRAEFDRLSAEQQTK